MTDTATTTKKWQRPLTRKELDALHEAIDAATTPSDALVAGLLGFFRLALPEATNQTWDEFTADPAAKLVPWDYAIPESQWGEIATWIADRGRVIDPIHAANHLLDWMNKGPSSYARREP